MARFAYDVNTRTRLIDIHKQFNGGLKTVDTDDALGSVYLRQAENVSLSEFGFIEKRYGTFEKEKIQQTTEKLQGYWEYLGYSIFVINGVFYYKDAAGTVTPVTNLYQESQDPDAPSTIYGKDWRYPDVFGSLGTITEVTGCVYNLISTQYQLTAPSLEEINAQTFTCGIGVDADDRPDYTVWTQISNGLGIEIDGNTYYSYWKGQTFRSSDTTRDVPVYTGNIGFPTTKDMNAVNVNDVLYIFTGKYPIYVKIVETPFGVKVPRFYVFPVTVPTYDEIVVTGHNLLEDDYDEVYFKNKADIQYTTPGTTTNYTALTNDFDERPFFVVQKDDDNIEIKQHAPQIAYQDGGELDFNFKYVINPDYLQAYNSGTQDRIFLLTVDDIGYRASGPGSIGYTSADPNSIEFTKLHNYTGSGDLQVSSQALTIENSQVNVDIDDLGTIQSPSTPTTGPSNPTDDVWIMSAKFLLGPATSYTTYLRFDMEVDTSNSGNDYVVKDAFEVGQDFEFKLEQQSGSANNPVEPVFIPTTADEVISGYFNDVPETITLNAAAGGTTSDVETEIVEQVLPRIKIIPVGENNVQFTQNQMIIELNDGLTKTPNGYRFRVPATLTRNSAVLGYYISLSGKISTSTIVGGSNYNTPSPNPTTKTINTNPIFQQMSEIETLTSSSATNLSTSKNIGVKLKNLLSGTFDFKLRYKLQKFTIDSNNFLQVTNDDDGEQFTEVFFYNVPITAEKLEDYPGITADFLPKLKPIWTCNKVMEHYGKLMVWGSTEMPTAVFYSFPDRPTYFPSKFYLDFSNDTNQPIEAVTPYMNILVAQTASQTWGIRGNSGLIDAPAPYTPFGINSTVGTIAYKSVRPVRNHLFFLSKQGVIALKSLYAADEQYNIDFVDRNIRNIVPQDSDAVGIQFDNQYWLNFPNNSITLRWYIDKKAWLKDVYQGYAENGFNGVFKYQIIDGKLEYITHPSTLLGENENEAIYKIAVDYDLPTDLYQPIKAKFETAFLNQNYPFHPKNYKEAKLDFTLQNEYNKGRVAIYDSSVDGVTTDYSTTANQISVTLGSGITLEKNHRYRVDFFLNPTIDSETGVVTYTPVPVTNIEIEGLSTYVHDDVSLNTDDNTVIATEWMMTNDDIATTGNVDITFTYSGDIITVSNTSESYVSIRDVTYDDSLTFDTYIISEDQTLNFNNYSGYDQASVDIGLDLTAKERLGDWTFGTSDFGKKITAVKTIKLSGKGYNAKLYLEDTSKSKWTLESMGITYKMKRARSR